MDLERDRRYGGGARGGREDYDDSFLREAMERKRMGEQQRARSQERLDSESDRSDRGRGARGPPPLPVNPPSGNPGRHNDYPPPPPPPYSEDEKKSNLRKVSHRSWDCCKCIGLMIIYVFTSYEKAKVITEITLLIHLQGQWHIACFFIKRVCFSLLGELMSFLVLQNGAVSRESLVVWTKNLKRTKYNKDAALIFKKTRERL